MKGPEATQARDGGVRRLTTIVDSFIRYPFLAAVIGAIFIVFGRGTRRRGAIAVGVCWLLYAAYETAMQQRWLCSGECNIRVDLLLIYPVLMITSLVAGFGMVRARRMRLSKR